MVVLSDICKECNCICNAIHFQQNFENWTSGNNDIDKFIQDVQLSLHYIDGESEVLEWIPYDKFYNIKNITKKEFGANWIDGNIVKWNDKNQKWKRKGQNIFVILKSLNDLRDIKSELSKV